MESFSKRFDRKIKAIKMYCCGSRLSINNREASSRQINIEKKKNQDPFPLPRAHAKKIYL